MNSSLKCWESISTWLIWCGLVILPQSIKLAGECDLPLCSSLYFSWYSLGKRKQGFVKGFELMMETSAGSLPEVPAWNFPSSPFPCRQKWLFHTFPGPMASRAGCCLLRRTNCSGYTQVNIVNAWKKCHWFSLIQIFPFEYVIIFLLSFCIYGLKEYDTGLNFKNKLSWCIFFIWRIILNHTDFNEPFCSWYLFIGCLSSFLRHPGKLVHGFGHFFFNFSSFFHEFLHYMGFTDNLSPKPWSQLFLILSFIL